MAVRARVVFPSRIAWTANRPNAAMAEMDPVLDIRIVRQLWKPPHNLFEERPFPNVLRLLEQAPLFVGKKCHSEFSALTFAFQPRRLMIALDADGCKRVLTRLVG